MERIVKNVWTIKNSLFLLFAFFISSNIVFASSGGKHTYAEIYDRLNKGALENLKFNLASENDGVRMQSVDQVGKLKIIQLEDDIIKLFDEEKSIINKKNIAVTLYQLGTYKALIKLEETAASINKCEVSDFCKWLIEEYSRNNLDSYSYIIKIEEMWAVDVPSSLMYREKN